MHRLLKLLAGLVPEGGGGMRPLLRASLFVALAIPLCVGFLVGLVPCPWERGAA